MTSGVIVGLKNTIADGTEDNLYLLVLPLGRQNLHPDGSIWKSTCKRC